MMSQLALKDMTAGSQHGAAWVTRWFWPIAAALLVVRVYVDSACNLVPDEAFYWTWTRHLSTGYFDHPPMIAWIIWLSTRVFGNTELGVRLPASLMSIGALGVLFAIARRVLADSRAVGFVMLMWIAGPLLPVIGTIITPDAPATFFSVCALACAVKLAAADDSIDPSSGAAWTHGAGWWIAFGVLCGLAFLSKYTTVLLPGGVALAFATSRRGIRHFARPWIYLAGIISLAVFSPCIYWNYRHHWASFAFQINHGAGGGLTEGVNGFFRQWLARFGGLAQFIGGQAMVWTPVLFGMTLLLLFSNWLTALRRAWASIVRAEIPLHDSSEPFSRHACVPYSSDRASIEEKRHASVPAKLDYASKTRDSLPSRLDWIVKFGKLNRLSEVDWLLLWSGTLPLVFFGIMAMRSHGEINWPAFAYFPLSLLLGRFLAENWAGFRVQWMKIGCQVALGFTIGMHLVALPRIQQFLIRSHVHITHQVTDLWGWNEFGRKLAAFDLPVVCNRHQDAGEAAFYMPGQPDVWCDGVGSRTTAFDFFDTGRPDYAKIPRLAFVGGHARQFEEKHGYTRAIEVTSAALPGLGKNRSHVVTVVVREAVK
ncbi:MAG TPA: glycosyltransferase family 39 protein [Tepidisphaeraceae bacterium]|nr:glycosyltransferase family 39 protein [Tepidisphaeraceae bacterium]